VAKDDDALVGRELGGFRLESRVGAGATGVVYRAEKDGEVFAVKVLNEGLGHIRSLRRRFDREARALGKLRHPHIVHIEDFGVVDNVVYIAMEFLVGDTLEDVLQKAPVDPADALHWMKEILEGLAFAHDRQIVHRDLKPANVFLVDEDEEKRLKILDFGLAKFLSVDELSKEGTLTRRGRVVGTPAYMAPEQITGVSLDVRADVYAAGVCLFELIADRRPFDYDRRSQLLRAHLFEPVPRLEEVRPELEVDEAFEEVLRKALAKDPNDRFMDARGMLEALAPHADGAVTVRGATKRSTERSTAGTTSVVISAEERMELASEAGVTDSVSDETEVDATAPPRENIPLGSLPPQPPSPPLANATPKPSGTVKAGLVWALGLIGLAALIGVVYYATTLQQ